jgi:hypothetical protein
MKRVWGHVSTGVLLVGGAILVAAPFPACVHDNSTLFIYDVLAPQFVTAGMTCTFTADPTQPVISAGTLDADLSAEYSPVFLVGNQVVPRGDPTQPHTETSFITIEGAVVTITNSDGTQLNSFTKPVAATVPPSTGTTPGFAPLQVTIIDFMTSGNLGKDGIDRVVSTVRFFGHTLGGESVESNDFGFPVDVCRGCLVSFPAAEQDNHLATPNCSLAGAAGGAAANIPCSIGQDLPVDCSVCQGIDVCRGALAGTTTIVDAGGGG